MQCSASVGSVAVGPMDSVTAPMATEGKQLLYLGLTERTPWGGKMLPLTCKTAPMFVSLKEAFSTYLSTNTGLLNEGVSKPHLIENLFSSLNLKVLLLA